MHSMLSIPLLGPSRLLYNSRATDSRLLVGSVIFSCPQSTSVECNGVQPISTAVTPVIPKRANRPSTRKTPNRPQPMPMQPDPTPTGSAKVHTFLSLHPQWCAEKVLRISQQLGLSGNSATAAAAPVHDALAVIVTTLHLL